MFSRIPSIQIDKVERIEINSPLSPIGAEVLLDYFRKRRRSIPYAVWPFTQAFSLPAEVEEKEPGLLKTLDYVSRGVSILSGIAVIVFVALLLSGQTIIGNVQIGTLLTVLSFTLVGGLISIGGIKMFSINASLRKAREKIERVVTAAGGCPFLYIFIGQPNELRRPGNPYFCVKCPLGIDIDSSREDGLIHICKVYPGLHRQWKELPGADRILRR